MMDKLRENFEKRFPVPDNCGWSIGLRRYRCDLDNVGLQATIDHIRRWEGYQACAESLRLAAAQNKLAHTTRSFESSLNHAEQERKYLSAQLASERAANAKYREFVVKWKETESDSQDEDFDRELFLLNAMADEALGDAVPVPDLGIQHEFALCNSEGQFGDWQGCGIERFTELAGDEYCRRRIIRYVAQDWQLTLGGKLREAVPVQPSGVNNGKH